MDYLKKILFFLIVESNQLLLINLVHIFFSHTLNGSGLATPRLMVALLETYQNEDVKIVFSDSAAEFIGMKEIN